METQVEMYRKDGRWVIELEAEQWVIDDILFDVNRKSPISVEVIISTPREGMGGATRWFGNSVIETPEIVDTISSYVAFEPVPKTEVTGD